MTSYCRKIPAKTVFKDPDILKRVEELVIDTNHIVRETYQFIRLYFLYLLENKQELPIIDIPLLRLVYSLVADKDKRGVRNKTESILTLAKRMKTFYTEHYFPLQTIKIKAVSTFILAYESTAIITHIENHIKTSFFSYVNRLAYCICNEDKTERRKVRNDLYKQTFTSQEKYHEKIQEFSQDIATYMKSLNTNPQCCLPLFYRICKLGEQEDKKCLAFLPLRRSLIPAHITIDAKIFEASFNDILKMKEEQGIWDDFWGDITDMFRSKTGTSFTSLKTDGIACSLTFGRGWGKKKNKVTKEEEYLEDVKCREELKEKKIVAIDPNKGNLVYCYDGEKILRYTQNERRHVSRKTKYKKIRKKKTTEIAVQLPNDTDFHTIRQDEEDLATTNSRSVSFEKFQNYLRKKNLMARRFSENLYHDTIFRKLKWNSYINLRRSEDLFINKFKATYGTEAVIAFGDWDEKNTPLKGKEPTKGIGLRRMFRQAGYQVYLVDEYKTSKLCYHCGKENKPNFLSRPHPKPWLKKQQFQKVWGLLRCTNGCGRVHNRDFNSASNIRAIATSVISLGVRPKKFQRIFQTCVTQQEVSLAGQKGV